ncbi:MAG: NAD(P)-dependent glycerol-3-phosphate dehydrogenase [Phycisphaerae bacterium]|nr:NAD(P)-dependent glycerol-3-phosphate dehydrogenase [Phycisphaerae bacterium]
MSEEVVIIGDGAMGTLAALLLDANGHSVTWWGYQAEYMAEVARRHENPRYLPGVPVPQRVRVTGDDAATGGAKLVVWAVPCQFTRRVGERLKPHLAAETAVCSVTKGIENETLLRPSEVLAAVLGPRPIAVLSGPCIAPEVVKGLPAAVAVAGESSTLTEHVQRILTTPWFRIYTNPDVVGVELGGATKNVIALAAGMIDGLQAGDNCKAALLTRGLVEITRLGGAMGASRETFAGLAGLGDLVTTCISPVGRNRSAGEQIGRGRTAAEVEQATASVIEGIATTRSVMALARRHRVEMPITEAVHRVLFESLRPGDAIAELMARQPRPEVTR